MGRKPRWLQNVFNRLRVYYRGSRGYGIKTTSREIPWVVKIRSRKTISHNRVLGSLRNFCFLIVRTIMVKYLSYIKGPIRKIQGRSLDLYEIVDLIRNTQTGVMLLRSEESDFYQRYYDYVIHVCNLIVVENSSWECTCSHALRLLSR